MKEELIIEEGSEPKEEKENKASTGSIDLTEIVAARVLYMAQKGETNE